VLHYSANTIKVIKVINERIVRSYKQCLGQYEIILAFINLDNKPLFNFVSNCSYKHAIQPSSILSLLTLSRTAQDLKDII
jgi:hypothetical protein